MKSGRSRSRISSTGCDVSLDTGLSEEEVQHRLSRYGSNTLRLFRQRGMLDLLFDQFKSLVVGLLAVAALTSFVYGHWLEGIAIVVVLGLNGAIGFATELRASRSMEALREMSQVQAVVRRDGEPQMISAEDLVPGDIATRSRRRRQCGPPARGSITAAS